MPKFVDKIVLSGNISTPFLMAKNYSRMAWSRIPKDYQLKIFHRQPVATIIKMCLTSKNAMETAEEALSDMPDVVLLRKIIKFFQETYPEDEKSMKLLSIRCSKSYLSHHHVTFEYEAVDLINGYKMEQFLLEKMNKKLRAEVKKRKKIRSKWFFTYTIQSKWEELNSRGIRTIDMAAIPDHIIVETIRKSSLAVLTRLWRSCRRLEAISIIYTTTTPKISWLFMIPNIRPSYGYKSFQRPVVWGYFLFKGAMDVLSYCRPLKESLPEHVRDEAVKYLYGKFRAYFYFHEYKLQKPTDIEWHRWGHCPIESPFEPRYYNLRKKLFLKSVIPLEDQ